MTVEEAQDVMVQFVREYIPKGKCPLAGNSVHVDRLFLVKYMKPFVDHLHYRIVDVSTVKELCRLGSGPHMGLLFTRVEQMGQATPVFIPSSEPLLETILAPVWGVYIFVHRKL